MSIPAVSYSFTNGTTADATQVNQCFQDLINGMTDGTRDFSIGTITVAGAVTLNGAVTLGNGTIDDVTITGSLASSINIKTNNAFDIGSSTLGLAGIYFGAAGSFTTRLITGATASYTLTLPPTSGSVGNILQNNGSAVTTWAPPPVLSANNYSFTTSVGTNAMTVALKDNAGNDASAASPVSIMFRSATATSGTNSVLQVTAALSIVISSGATLGLVSATDQFIHVYALNNAGTVELAVAGARVFDEGSVQSTTAMSGTSTLSNVLYSTTSRSNVAIRYLGRLKSNQTTSGTYTATATEVASLVDRAVGPRSEVWVYGSSAYGSTNDKIPIFSTVGKNIGTAITRATSATLGDSFTINEDGVYGIHVSYNYSASDGVRGISLNSTQLTTAIASITITDYLAGNYDGTNGAQTSVSVQTVLKAGDVVRAHMNGTATGSSDLNMFRIVKLSN